MFNKVVTKLIDEVAYEAIEINDYAHELTMDVLMKSIKFERPTTNTENRLISILQATRDPKNFSLVTILYLSKEPNSRYPFGVQRKRPI